MTPTRTLCLLVAAALCVACGPAAPTEPPTGPLRAAAAVRVVDVAVGHSHAGYAQSRGLTGIDHPPDDPGSPFADRFPASRGMQSPIAARVVLLDNGHARVVIAKLDVIFITWALTERVIELARTQLGEEIGGQLLLQATHTHAGPGRMTKGSIDLVEEGRDGIRNALSFGTDSYSQETTDKLAQAVVDALKESLAELRPASFGYGERVNETAARDRRCQNDWLDGGPLHDTRVTELRVDDAETGQPIAVMFHYAIHGTVNGGTSRWLSVDAPGHAEYAVERLFDTPMVAVFLQGSAGDVSPNGHGNGGTQAMQRIGWDLAQTVAALHPTIELKRELVLQASERWIPIGHELLGYEPDEFTPDGAILCQFSYPNEECTPATLDPEDVLCVGYGVPGGGSYATRLAVARIGDVALLTLPGEPMTAVGKALETKALQEPWVKRAVVLGYANDHQGYVMLDDDWLSGGYEPTISLWGWKFGRYVVDESARSLEALRTGAAFDASGITLPKLEPLEYTPVPATDSAGPPTIEQQPAARVERLETVSLTFLGGDPALGTPVVTLERRGDDGAFAPARERGWIPVSSVTGGDFPIRYEGTPSFFEDRDATVRTHRWFVVYEPPLELPVGTYRLHVAGQARLAGATTPMVLDSQPFELTASTALRFESRLAVEAGRLVADLVPVYPARRPTNDPTPRNDGWQRENFRLPIPQFRSPFAPAVPTGAVAATLALGDAAQSLSFAPSGTPVDSGRSSYDPGDGPGLRGEAGVTTGQWVLTIAAGAFTDGSGNTNAAQSFTIDVP